MFGLTSAGSYIARTAGEWFEYSKTQYNSILAGLNVEPPRYDISEFSTAMLVLHSGMAGAIDNAIASVLDFLSPNNVSKEALKIFGREISGLTIREATFSRATCTVGAWTRGQVTLAAGTTKASDGTNVWILDEDVVIPAGGTATATFRAEVTGPIFTGANTIVERLTGVPGWVSVDNTDAPSVGSDEEAASSFRVRIGRGQGSFGSRSELSIKSAIEALAGVTRARIFYNTELNDVDVSGVTVRPGAMAVWVYPDDIPDATKAQILNVLFGLASGATGRTTPDSTGASGVVGRVEGAYGQEHLEGFYYMTPQDVGVRVTITAYEGNGSLETVQEDVRQAVLDYILALGPGDAVRQNDLIGAVASVAGVARSTVELTSSSGVFWDEFDEEIDAGSFAQLDPSMDPPIIVQE